MSAAGWGAVRLRGVARIRLAVARSAFVWRWVVRPTFVWRWVVRPTFVWRWMVRPTFV